MTAINETGENGERIVYRRLKRRLSSDICIVWTRRFKINAPFDFVVLDKECEPMALLEVKTFEPDRKIKPSCGYWFQQSKKSIKRKLLWQKDNAPFAEIFTVSVELGKKNICGFIDGLPNCPIDWTEPLNDLINQLNRNASLEAEKRYWIV